MPDDLNTDNIGELHGRPHAVKPNGSAKPGGEIDDDLGGFKTESEHPNVLDDAEEIRLDPNQEIHESVKVLAPCQSG